MADPRKPLHELEAEWKARRRQDRPDDDRLAEPCACGGTIEAANQWVAIVEAVRDHATAPRHRAWRREKERHP